MGSWVQREREGERERERETEGERSREGERERRRERGRICYAIQKCCNYMPLIIRYHFNSTHYNIFIIYYNTYAFILDIPIVLIYRFFPLFPNSIVTTTVCSLFTSLQLLSYNNTNRPNQT